MNGVSEFLVLNADLKKGGETNRINHRMSARKLI